MKTLLTLISVVFLFNTGITLAGRGDPGKITFPRFKCPVEVTLYVIYEPNAGPYRNYNAIEPVLSGWAGLGPTIGESLRIVDDRTEEDGIRTLTRATTIRTHGGMTFRFPAVFLGKIIRYTVEDPTTKIVFVFWQPGMPSAVQNLHQPDCR